MKSYARHLVIGAVVALVATAMNMQVCNADDGPSVSIGTMQVSPKGQTGKRNIGPTIKVERPHLSASVLDSGLKPGKVHVNLQKPQVSPLNVDTSVAASEQPQPQPRQQQGATPAVPSKARNTRHAAQGTTSIVPVRMSPPRYPREALITGKSGKVVIQFTVVPNGSTRNIRVLSSNPPGIFDKAARHAVRNWRFKPISDPARVTQTINFVPPR